MEAGTVNYHYEAVPKWFNRGIMSSLHYEILPACRTVHLFHEYKQTNIALDTDPFYTSHDGYKATLCVCPNGDGSGNGTHVSVFICLMKGPNDDNLPFPINGIFTVQILNWKEDHYHIEGSIKFDEGIPMECRERVTKGDRATSWGYQKFISHEDLVCMNVLHEDMMCFKISFIPIQEIIPDGECIYSVSGPSPKEIDYQDKGVISLVIPAGTIPLDVSCSISIKPIQPSQCTFPDDTVLVSELFEVTTSCDINEPITIKLRHCVELPDDNNHEGFLTFLKAEHKKSPLQFNKQEGGTFTWEYGILECRNFSYFGIGWIQNIFNNRLFPLQCCALLLHAYNPRTSTHMGHVIVTKDNGDLIMKTAKSLLKDGSIDVHPQKFSMRQNTLTVRCPMESEEHGHWSITPYRTPSEIPRRAIENFNDPQSGTTPPWLDYKIKMSDDCPIPFMIPFTFEGASAPFEMNLFIEIPSVIDTSMRQDSISSSISHLTIEDHNEVYRQVESLKVDWLVMGTNLGVPYTPDLQAIDRSSQTNEQKLMEMLSVWLKRGGSRRDQPMPTWRILHEAVETLDRNIAENIAKDHL